MATDLRSAGQPSLTVLMKGIMNDVQDLVRQQIAMFKMEIKSDIRKTRQVAVLMANGVGGIAVGGVFFLIMLPLLLNWLVPAIPLWACFGIMSAAAMAVGGTLVLVAVQRFKSFDPLPTQSVEALKENLTWTTHPK
jgi:hypothetical protein